MTYTLYCYRESKPSNDKDECHINRVLVDEEDKDDELVEPVNQYITPPLRLLMWMTNMDAMIGLIIVGIQDY